MSTWDKIINALTDKTFIAQVATIVALLVGLVRGVSVSPAVQQQIDTTARQAAVAAENADAAKKTGEANHEAIQKVRAAVAKDGDR